MINVHLDRVRTILCIGAHADDIEIGCGGSILKLLSQNSDVRVYWVVLSAIDQRAEEAQSSARRFLAGAGESHVRVNGFRDSFFPYAGEPIKEYFFDLRKDASPDLIFTHRREDLHQDHRLVSELTWNTFRNHLIFEYEIPKYEGDLGTPNVFVQLSEPTCEQKVDTIVSSFATQRDKHWFSKDTFWSLLRIRGIESASSSQFAEGFHCRKMIL